MPGTKNAMQEGLQKRNNKILKLPPSLTGFCSQLLCLSHSLFLHAKPVVSLLSMH